MTQALLIVDHGSRIDAANDLLIDLIEALRIKKPELIIEMAHMELAEPSIEQGFQACVDLGATHVIVHPYMLAPGRHATQDIPRLASDAAKQHPHVTHMVTAPLGLHDGIFQAIFDRAGLS